jgi:hypothetical protein
MNKNLIKYVKENLNASDAEIEFTSERMWEWRVPLDSANPSLRDRICDLVEEFAEENEGKLNPDDVDIEELFYEL